jgi:hypothetical protein
MERAYGGTGAPYTTLAKVAAVLDSLGLACQIDVTAER